MGAGQSFVLITDILFVTLVVAAAVVVTVAAVTVFVFTVMVTFCIRVIVKAVSEQCCNSNICVALYTAVQSDACLSKSLLCTAADTAADKHRYAETFKKTGKSTVTGAACIYNSGSSYTAFCYIVNFKLFCMSEMLENVSVFVCYCYSHCKNLRINIEYQFFCVCGIRHSRTGVPCRRTVRSHRLRF